LRATKFARRSFLINLFDTSMHGIRGPSRLAIRNVLTSKPVALAAMIAVLALTACNSPPAWKRPVPLAAAHIAADPFLNLPPHSPDIVVKPALEEAIATAYSQSDFAKLDAMAKYYRDTGARTPAGTWKLSIFYESLAADQYSSNRSDDTALIRSEDKDLAWIAAIPKSPTPYIVYGEQLITHGWFFRGNGYSYTVSQTGFDKFYDYLARARGFLEKNKAIAAADPDWYCAMLKIALGQRWTKDQYEPLMKEGLDRFPFYYRIYFEGARTYLPIWGGNIDDLASFVDDAVARTSSREGTTLYWRIYSGNANAFGNLFKESRATWPRMFDALQGMRQLYPDPRNDNRFAYYACVAGDWVWMTRMIPLIQNAPELDIWGTRGYFDSCRKWALSGKIPADKKFRYDEGPFD
jgi:hypothetical protein